jgi:NTE family protein
MTEDKFDYPSMIQAGLKEYLGIDVGSSIHSIQERISIIDIQAGHLLIRQGDVSDAMFIVLAGRLQAIQSTPNTPPRILGEIGRGEMIGEMGVIQSKPRSADVIALRDCQLLKIFANDFQKILEEFPQATMPMMKKLLNRISSNNAKNEFKPKPINICLLPLEKTIYEGGRLDDQTFVIDLKKHLQSAYGSKLFGNNKAEINIFVYDPRDLPKSITQRDVKDEYSEGTNIDQMVVIKKLDETEKQNNHQLLLAQSHDSIWTRVALRQADVVILLTTSENSPEVKPIEELFFTTDYPLVQKKISLCIIHSAEEQFPKHTSRWLSPRPYLAGTVDMPKHSSHYHIRAGKSADMARLARILSGNGVGLVLAGGGAKGFVQLGIIQALEEAGIEWDYCCGTSMGAIVAAAAAMDIGASRMKNVFEKAFSENPTSDINLIPLISIIRGKKLQSILRQAATDAMNDNTGYEPEIEDLWKPFFCVASNYSQSKSQILRQGHLTQSLLASAAIPGALPPVIWQNDLLIDGGVFNNYPVDLMYEQGAKYVIGVNMEQFDYKPISFKHIPNTLNLLIDKIFRRKSTKRYLGLPSISSVIFKSVVMSSIDHQRKMDELADLSFSPKVRGVSMLDWSALSRLVKFGREYASSVIQQKLELAVDKN